MTLKNVDERNTNYINPFKSSFKLFDYFKKLSIFEEEFDYNQVLQLPTGGTGGDPPHPPTNIDEIQVII